MLFEKLKNQKKKIIFIAIIIVIGGFFISKVRKNSSDNVIFLTEKVKIGNISESVIATGTVRSNNRVEVGAQVSGKITNINVTLGQEVKKGDLIATIDSTTQENEFEKAKSQLISYESQLESKKISLEVTESKYNRAKNLYKLKSISQDEYETAKQEYYMAKSDLKEIEELIKQAKIEVKTAETNLSYTIIVSPIDGVIISIPVSVGQTVNSNQTTPTIVQVADLKKMLIKPEISEGDITKIKKGLDVEFTILSSPDKVYKAKIDSVDPAVTTLTDNAYEESVSNNDPIYYYANIVVDNEDNLLRIGMTTTNIIKVAQAENVIIVPTEALEKRSGKYYVNVLKEKNQVEKREVEIGINDEINTEIKNGLLEGETVVITEMKSSEKMMSSRRIRF